MRGGKGPGSIALFYGQPGTGKTLAAISHKYIDEAFIRRLCFEVEFPVPDEDERRRIWKRVFLGQPVTERFADLLSLFELTGGNIRNALLYAAMEAADNGRSSICLSEVVMGIERDS